MKKERFYMGRQLLRTEEPRPRHPGPEKSPEGGFMKKMEEDHARIKKLFEELEPVVSSRVIEDMVLFRKKLKELEDVVVEHLKMEDELFYQSLKDKALEKKQDGFLPVIDLYKESMFVISRKVLSFFSRYREEEDISVDPEGFFSSFKDIRYEILKRISKEERALFYIYRTCFLG
jgi:hypothetical protein